MKRLVENILMRESCLILLAGIGLLQGQPGLRWSQARPGGDPAQQPSRAGVVTGTVLDPSGRAIVRARVALVRSDG
ncbi:MAG: hypothetical protein WA628_26455, partial [Terriglobales bacterium]